MENNKRKRKDNDMMISFEEFSPKERWQHCLKALQTDYTLSFKKACNILMCNRSWVQRYVRPHVHYIYLSNGIRFDERSIFRPNYVKLAEKELKEILDDEYVEMRESIWMNAKEFDSVVREHMTCTRQTILIPIEAFIRKERLEEFQKMYMKLKNEPKLLDKLMDDDMTNDGREEYICRVSRYQRSKAKAAPCVPRDYDLTELKAVHDEKGYGDTDEEIYRRFFAEGDYRLQLELSDCNNICSKKIYYLSPTDDERELILTHIGIQKSVRWVLVSYARFIDFAAQEMQYHLIDLIK